MKFVRLFGVALLILVAAAGYAVYAPDAADRWVPPVAGMAHGLHQRLFAKSDVAVSAAAVGGPSPIVVSVAAVRRSDFPIILESLGQVQAYNTVLVRARVDGEITKIAFKEGQTVKAGDLLAQIDPRPFRATLDQALAKKAQDEANLANAKLDLARYATLAKQNFATQQQLDTQNSLVNQLTASIAADAASTAAAQVQLDYTTIRAPISGRVGFRLIDEGNLVNAGQQTGIVSIAQLQPISVVFTEPQEYVDRINEELRRRPMEVAVKNADGERLAVGKLTVSDNQVDAATGTIRLKAEFDNKDGELWPGLAVTTDLTLGVDRDVLTVPEGAIQHGQNGLFVYVVDERNRAAVRPVKVARQNAMTAVISEGLSGGEQVVTTGQLLLQPGALVAIDAGRGS
jgi:multidrug efflux system membrane fusion protein